MDRPLIAATKPKTLKLKAGTYVWCACGRSQNQPFCDGSHRGTSFKPKVFILEKAKEVTLCMCKRTQHAPDCDGTHAKLDPKEVEENRAPAKSHSKRAEHPEPRNTPEEPYVAWIHALARDGLRLTGPHGELGAMGVPRAALPHWDDIQILPAQLAEKPLQEEEEVGTELVVGPRAKRPLRLEIPLIVSDMSFGSLSEEAKVALARGAEGAGTGICSGEGGMLPEEQAENSRYFYELASGKFGFGEHIFGRIQAFHFKAGQAAKTGVGAYLPGNKVTQQIAQVRGIPVGKPAISPTTFRDLVTVKDFKKMADEVRDKTGGIPIGFKMSANHIEEDLAFALEVGADYIILDGRGGGTGAAPIFYRDHISVPTIPALARARRFLDAQSKESPTLFITGGLRTPADFVKALCLGADGIALANSAIQAVGCVGARICHTNNCPSGVATQQPKLRALINVKESAQRLTRFLQACVELMRGMARACGHRHLGQFELRDITTWKREVAELGGIAFAGLGAKP